MKQLVLILIPLLAACGETALGPEHNNPLGESVAGSEDPLENGPSLGSGTMDASSKSVVIRGSFEGSEQTVSNERFRLVGTFRPNQN